jgi:pilus assembly protein CpaF
VVFVSRHPKTGARRLETILEVNGFDQTVQASEIFKANGAQTAEWTGVMPSRADELEAAGWDVPGGVGSW